MVARADILAGRAVILVNIQDTIEAQLRSIRSKMRMFSNSMKEIGGDLFRGGLAGTAGSIFPVKEFVNFQDQLLFLQTKLQVTDAAMKPLEKTIRQLGMSTSFTSQEVAKAATDFAQAGFSMVEITNSLQAALDLARGSQIELSTSTTILANALRTFNVSTEKAADFASKFIAAARLGTLDLVDLSESLKYSSGTFALLNVEIDEVLGLITQLSKSSLKASLAGTSLNTAFLNLAGSADKLKELLGVVFTDEDFEQPLVVLTKIEKALQGMSTTKKISIVQDLVNIRGARAVFGEIIQDLGKLDETTKQIRNSTNEARLSAEKLDSRLGGVWRRARSAFEESLLAVGATTEGPLTRFGEVMAKVFNDISRLAQSNEVLTQSILGMGVASLAAGVGILALSTLFGRLAMFITPLTMLNAQLFKMAGALVGLQMKTFGSIGGAIAAPLLARQQAVAKARMTASKAEEQLVKARARYEANPNAKNAGKLGAATVANKNALSALSATKGFGGSFGQHAIPFVATIEKLFSAFKALPPREVPDFKQIFTAFRGAQRATNTDSSFLSSNAESRKQGLSPANFKLPTTTNPLTALYGGSQDTGNFLSPKSISLPILNSKVNLTLPIAPVNINKLLQTKSIDVLGVGSEATRGKIFDRSEIIGRNAPDTSFDFLPPGIAGGASGGKGANSFRQRQSLAPLVKDTKSLRLNLAPVIGFFKSLGRTISALNFGHAFAELGKVLKALWRGASSIDWVHGMMRGFRGAWTAVRGIFTVLNGIRRVVFSFSGILTIVELLIVFGDKLPGISTLLEGAGKAFSTLFKNLGGTLKSLAPTFDHLGTAIKLMFSGEAMSGIAEAQKAFANMRDLIGLGLTNAWQQFVADTKPFADWMKVTLLGTLYTIEALFNTIATTVGGVFKTGILTISADGDLLETLKSAFSVDSMKVYFGAIIGFIGSIGEGLTQVLMSVAQGINIIKRTFFGILQAMAILPGEQGAAAQAALNPLDKNFKLRQHFQKKVDALDEEIDKTVGDGRVATILRREKLRLERRKLQDQIELLTPMFDQGIEVVGLETMETLRANTQSLLDKLNSLSTGPAPNGLGPATAAQAEAQAQANTAKIPEQLKFFSDFFSGTRGVISGLGSLVNDYLTRVPAPKPDEALSNLFKEAGVTIAETLFGTGQPEQIKQTVEAVKANIPSIGKALVGTFDSTRGNLLQGVPTMEKLQREANEKLDDANDNLDDIVSVLSKGATFVA